MHEPMTAKRLADLRLLAQSAYEPTAESMVIWLKNAPTPHDILDLLDEIRAWKNRHAEAEARAGKAEATIKRTRDALDDVKVKVASGPVDLALAATTAAAQMRAMR